MPAERGDAAEESPATPGDWLYRAPHRPMGMTAEVAGTPCKRRRSGFDSRHLHCAASAAHHGIEEDGNLPDSDSGETRFDSAGPDRDVV